jgi:hypothetical protein
MLNTRETAPQPGCGRCLRCRCMTAAPDAVFTLWAGAHTSSCRPKACCFKRFFAQGLKRYLGQGLSMVRSHHRGAPLTSMSLPASHADDDGMMRPVASASVYVRTMYSQGKLSWGRSRQLPEEGQMQKIVLQSSKWRRHVQLVPSAGEELAKPPACGGGDRCRRAATVACVPVYRELGQQ